jgi:hypothetical protein
MAMDIRTVKQAYDQQNKAYDLGMFCIKYRIEKSDLQNIAHEKLMADEKEICCLYTS